MRFFTVFNGKKIVSDHLQEPCDLGRDDWTQLFMELGFEIENQLDLAGKHGKGAFIDNYYHSQDSDLQLEHLHKMGDHKIWAVRSEKRGRTKNRDLVKKHSIMLASDMTYKQFCVALENLLVTIREQYQ
tara:strand:- start:7266 stop:7652 length:387 start_codon:yes stop_codon:yes gene_type:complete